MRTRTSVETDENRPGRKEGNAHARTRVKESRSWNGPKSPREARRRRLCRGPITSSNSRVESGPLSSRVFIGDVSRASSRCAIVFALLPGSSRATSPSAFSRKEGESPHLASRGGTYGNCVLAHGDSANDREEGCVFAGGSAPRPARYCIYLYRAAHTCLRETKGKTRVPYVVAPTRRLISRWRNGRGKQAHVAHRGERAR